MKFKVTVGSLLSLASILVAASPILALSGPTGLNNIRTEAGPGAGQITLNWQRYNSDITSYEIKYGLTPGDYTLDTGLIGNVATYTITGLKAGARYYFRLIPFRNGVQSESLSSEVSDMALSRPHTVVGTPGPYGQRHLKATIGPKKGQITLTWQKLYPDVDNYHVVYGLQPGKYIYGAQNIGSDPTGFNTFVVSSLQSGVRYYFAINPSRAGQSLYDSAEVSIVAK